MADLHEDIAYLYLKRFQQAPGSRSGQFIMDTPEMRSYEAFLMGTYDLTASHSRKAWWPEADVIDNANAWAWQTVFQTAWLRTDEQFRTEPLPSKELAEAAYWFTDAGKLDPRVALAQYQQAEPPAWVAEAKGLTRVLSFPAVAPEH